MNAYIKPEILVHNLQVSNILAGSPTLNNVEGNGSQLAKDNFFHFIGESNGTDEDE